MLHGECPDWACCAEEPVSWTSSSNRVILVATFTAVMSHFPRKELHICSKINKGRQMKIEYIVVSSLWMAQHNLLVLSQFHIIPKYAPKWRESWWTDSDTGLHLCVTDACQRGDQIITLSEMFIFFCRRSETEVKYKCHLLAFKTDCMKITDLWLVSGSRSFFRVIRPLII